MADTDSLPTLSGPFVPRDELENIPAPQIEGYEIIGQLGQAGQGRVWRALQKGTNRQVALKVPRLEMISSQVALRRFEREVELAARLEHPNIAGIYDSGVHRDVYYYAMELIEGLALDEYVESVTLSIDEKISLLKSICGAIQYSHQNGVIHRDIKPSNVIVDRNGCPHVVDFGLAASMRDDGTHRTMTLTGDLTGTPAYMSPEQVQGHHASLDTRTDVYSLGVLMYRVITGRFPYDVRTSVFQTLQNIKDAEPVKPSKVLGGLNRDIEAIILKALAKDKDHRYASAGELYADIDRWQQGLPILARSGSSAYLLRKIMGRHRYTTAVAVLLLIIVTGFSIFSLQLYGRLHQAEGQIQTLIASINEMRQEFGQSADSVLITRYILPAYHSDDMRTARFYAGTFDQDVSLGRVFEFLLDEEAGEGNVQAFCDEMYDRHPGLAEFFAGEYHLKNRDEDKARDSYLRCVEYVEPDYDWIEDKARSRLYELQGK